MRAFLAKERILRLFLAAVFCSGVFTMHLLAGDRETANDAGQANRAPADNQSPTPGEPAPHSLWKYSGFVDFGYLLDFNHPANHLFRDRSTTFKVDELDLNMAGAGV